MSYISVGQGKILGQILQTGKNLPNLTRILEAEGLEVYFRSEHVEPHENGYILASDLGDGNLLYAEVSLMGSPLRVELVDITSRRLELLLDSNPRGAYFLHDTITKVPLFEDDNLESKVDKILTYLHDASRKPSRKTSQLEVASDFQVLPADRLKERHKHISELQGGNHIIADLSDGMIVVEAAQGCGKGCVQCPYANIEFDPKTREEFKKKVLAELRSLRSIYGNSIQYLEDLFLLVADIGRQQEASSKDIKVPTPEELARIAVRSIKDELGIERMLKVESFISIEYALQSSRIPEGAFGKGYRQIGPKSYNSSFFDGLHTEGVSRLVIGLEYGHPALRRIFGKQFSNEEFDVVMALLYHANIRPKITIIMGAFDEALTSDGRITWKQSLNSTAELLAKHAHLYRIMPSVIQPHLNPHFVGLYRNNGHIGLKAPADFFEAAERDIEYFGNLPGIRGLVGRGTKLEFDYHQYLPNPEEKFANKA